MSDWADQTSKYYTELLEKHGVGFAAVDCGSLAGQELRFSVLIDMVKGWQISDVLDVGCGYGAFLDYLKRTIPFSDKAYIGIDVAPGMIAAAQERHPQASFYVRDIIANSLQHEFDTVVASGIFQLDVGGSYWSSMIRAMWDHTERVCAFNMLSRQAEKQVPGEAYFCMDEVAKFCSSLTPYVSVRHDYRKNDFTIAMYRVPQEA